jgi:hypothetical protein
VKDSDEDFENRDRVMRSNMASSSCGIELPQVPLSDWLIRSEEIVICRRPDGSLYELGTGAFGKVVTQQFRSTHHLFKRSHVCSTQSLLQGALVLPLAFSIPGVQSHSGRSAVGGCEGSKE